MLKNIPQSRLIIYVMTLGVIPILLVWMNFSNKKDELNRLQNRITYIEDQTFIQENKQAINRAVLAQYADADRYYIDTNLETLKFLTPETESLQVLVENKNFAGDDTVRKRLSLLKGPNNNLLFSEGNVQAFPLYQETIASLVRPVEINNSDLKKILSLVEGVTIPPHEPASDRPQMIILDFRIDKKEVHDKNDIFILNMKILKREYSS